MYRPRSADRPSDSGPTFSLAPTPAAAIAGAQDATGAILAGRALTCHPRTVTVDAAAVTPGGQVTVSVACTVRLADLSGLGLPGTVVVTGSARQPIDTYRS